MAKKQNIPGISKGLAPASPKAAVVNVKTDAETKNFIARYAQFFIVAGIALVTYLSYKACLDNKLTNWDDLGYITNNALIKDPSPDAVKNIFSTAHPVMGNYHPLTILLYYYEYARYGLQPWIYHFDSVMLHILVTVVVYFFIKTLTGRTVAAMVAALLFGLHPMHVESVAWAAGRKDILYGLFFILACIGYLYYLRNSGARKIVWYTCVLILFACSLLSKAVAVTLPITLFLLDHFEGRKLFTSTLALPGKSDVSPVSGKRIFNYWLILDKVPLLLLAYKFGTLAQDAQEKVGATKLDVVFNPMERFALGCYALCTYLWKAVAPVGLTNFYPYPLKVGGALPAAYYVYPVITLVLIAGIVFLLKKFSQSRKPLIFGLGFFMVNIVLLLQFIPVGGAIMSDRYGYIPYLGLFFIVGWYVSEYFESQGKVQTGKIILGVVTGYCLVLGYMTSERCKDWYDSVTLWKDNIEKHPEGPVGYFYLGQEYFTRYEASSNPAEQKIMGDSAMINFNLSVQRKPDYINPIICIAEMQRKNNQVDEARKTYYQALKINPANESVYLGLGVVYAIKHQFDSADYSFRKAISLKAFLPEGYSNYANFLDIEGKVDSSLAMYAVAIAQNPDAYIPYMNRGKILFRQGKYDNAIKDLSMAIEKALLISYEPAESYYIRARCYVQKGNKVQARQDLEKARSLGFTQIAPDLVQQLR